MKERTNKQGRTKEKTKVIFPRFLGQFDVSFQAARVTVVGTIFS